MCCLLILWVEHRLEIVLSGTRNHKKTVVPWPNYNQSKDLISIVAGTPTNYYIKNRITIVSNSITAYILALYYSPRVVDMASDSDSPDVPEQFMEYVAILAAFDGFYYYDRAPSNLCS